MRIYKYLTKEEYASTWIDGGTAPVLPASTYRSQERLGTMTPDEVVHQKFSSHGAKRAFESGAFGFAPNFVGVVQFENVTIEGFQHQIDPIRIDGTFDRFEQDALIDCYSTELSSSLAERLGKAAIVEVMDIDSLLDQFDGQIGSHSERHLVSYTEGLERGHFMKSVSDNWQREFRAVWTSALNVSIEVNIPSGFCRRVL